MLLVAGIVLVCLSRTRRWWGRFAILVPAAVGCLAGLGHPGRHAGHRRQPDVGAERDAARALDDRRGLRRQPGRAGPARPPSAQDLAQRPAGARRRTRWSRRRRPRSAGRCSRPSCATWPLSCRATRSGLRLSALWTASTAWLYLSGLLVGVTIWVIYRWWPTAPGTQVTGADRAMAVMFLITGAFGWTAAELAAVRMTPAQAGQPGAEATLHLWRLGSPQATRREPTADARGDRRRTATP